MKNKSYTQNDRSQTEMDFVSLEEDILREIMLL